MNLHCADGNGVRESGKKADFLSLNQRRVASTVVDNIARLILILTQH